MSVRKKVLLNTVAQFINRFALAGSAFLASLLIARTFGARGFGEYSKATTFIALFYLFTDFGLNAIALREINQKPHQEERIIGNLYGFRLLLGIFLTIIALLVTLLLPYDMLRNEGYTPVAKGAIAALSVLIIYQAFLNTANVIFQKHLKYEKSTLASIFGSLVTLGAVVILLFFNSSLPVVLLGYTIGSFVTSIFIIYFVKKLFPVFRPQFSLSESKRMFIKALPLGLTLVFNLVYFRADIFVLTLYRTTTEVGTYGLAYKFFEFTLAIPTLFANSLYPILLSRVTDRKLFRSTIIKSGIFLFVISIIIMLGFYLFSPLLQIIRTDFFPSIAVLRLLSLSLPFFFLSSLFMWILITHGKNKGLLYIYFAGMVINVILCFIFIPVYGITAAAMITLVSELLILLISGYVARKLMIR